MGVGCCPGYGVLGSAWVMSGSLGVEVGVVGQGPLLSQLPSSESLVPLASPCLLKPRA